MKKDDSIHVLVVEDDPHHYEMIRRLLQGYPQFTLHWQQSLRSTKLFLQRFQPDIIICDWRLPDGAGIDLIKSRNEDLSYPVLLLTAHRNDRSAVAAIKAGAVDFLTKDPEQLARLPFVLTSIYYQWQAQQAIQKQEKERQLQRIIAETIFNHVNVGLLLVDQSYTIQAVNPFFYHLFGAEASSFQKGVCLESLDSIGTKFVLSMLLQQASVLTSAKTLIQHNGKDIEVHSIRIGRDEEKDQSYLLLFYDISTYTARNRLIEMTLDLATFSGNSDKYLQFVDQEFHKIICFDFFLAAKCLTFDQPIQKIYGSADFHSFINHLCHTGILTPLINASQSFLVQIPDLDVEVSIKPFEEIQSVIGVPLSSKDALPFNLFLFGKSKPNEFSVDDLHLIESLTHQVVITYERLLLKEREVEQRQTAEALLKFISLLSEQMEIEQILRRVNTYLKDYIHCSYSQVWIVQKIEFEPSAIVQVFEDRLSYRLPLREFPLLENLYQNSRNELYLLKQEEIDPESQKLLPEAKVYLFLPVFLKKDYAIITLIAFDEEKVWLEDKVNIFSAFASQIAHLIQSAQLIRENQELALVDELTGLYNRRGLNLLAKREFEFAVHNQTPLSICFCDIDNFKHFNDTYSYQTGDLVLQSVAKIIQREMRKADFAARYGGDEFIIFLPGTPASRSRAIIERITKAVAEQTIRSKGKDLKISLSFGVSEISPTDTYWTEIAARAARQMQENKPRH